MLVTQQDRDKALECLRGGDGTEESARWKVAIEFAGFRLLKKVVREFFSSDEVTLPSKSCGCVMCNLRDVFREIEETEQSPEGVAANQFDEPLIKKYECAPKRITDDRKPRFGLPLSQKEIESSRENLYRHPGILNPEEGAHI